MKKLTAALKVEDWMNLNFLCLSQQQRVKDPWYDTLDMIKDNLV